MQSTSESETQIRRSYDYCMNCRTAHLIRVINRWEKSGPLVLCLRCGAGWVERTGMRVYSGTKD